MVHCRTIYGLCVNFRAMKTRLFQKHVKLLFNYIISGPTCTFYYRLLLEERDRGRDRGHEISSHSDSPLVFLWSQYLDLSTCWGASFSLKQNDRPNALLSCHASRKLFPVGLNLNASCTARPEALCFQVVHRILVHVISHERFEINHDSRMNWLNLVTSQNTFWAIIKWWHYDISYPGGRRLNYLWHSKMRAKSFPLLIRLQQQHYRSTGANNREPESLARSSHVKTALCNCTKWPYLSLFV